jgi:hypothetical protein
MSPEKCRGTSSHGEGDEAHDYEPLRIVDKRISLEKVSEKIVIGGKNRKGVTSHTLLLLPPKP